MITSQAKLIEFLLKSVEPQKMEQLKLSPNLISFADYKNGNKKKRGKKGNFGEMKNEGINLSEKILKEIEDFEGVKEGVRDLKEIGDEKDEVESVLAALELSWEREKEKSVMLLDLSKKRIREKDRRIEDLIGRLSDSEEIVKDLKNRVKDLEVMKYELLEKHSEIKKLQNESELMAEEDSEIVELAEELKKSETRSMLSKSEKSDIDQEKHRLKIDLPESFAQKSEKKEYHAIHDLVSKNSESKTGHLTQSSNEELYDEYDISSAENGLQSEEKNSNIFLNTLSHEKTLEKQSIDNSMKRAEKRLKFSPNSPALMYSFEDGREDVLLGSGQVQVTSFENRAPLADISLTNNRKTSPFLKQPISYQKNQFNQQSFEKNDEIDNIAHEQDPNQSVQGTITNVFMSREEDPGTFGKMLENTTQAKRSKKIENFESNIWQAGAEALKSDRYSHEPIEEDIYVTEDYCYKKASQSQMSQQFNSIGSLYQSRPSPTIMKLMKANEQKRSEKQYRLFKEKEKILKQKEKSEKQNQNEKLSKAEQLELYLKHRKHHKSSLLFKSRNSNVLKDSKQSRNSKLYCKNTSKRKLYCECCAKAYRDLQKNLHEYRMRRGGIMVKESKTADKWTKNDKYTKFFDETSPHHPMYLVNGTQSHSVKYL